ncbi:MAG: efflux RND transporter permease subunit [Planctomycetota bacterium]
MKALATWFARHAVASNLLMLTLLIGGLFSLSTIKIEMFKEFSLDTVTVSVPFLGAAPEDVERGISVKIEEEVHSLEGVRRVTSTSVEGMSSVMIEVERGFDVTELRSDVESRVDGITTFPAEAEAPVVEELTMRRKSITLVLSGDAEEATLHHWGERLRDELLTTPGISQVELEGLRPEEVSIEVRESTLRRYDLTLEAVAEAIRSSSLDLAGGTLRTTAGDILVRTQSQAYSAAEFAAIPIQTRPDGTRLVLSDIAEVRDTFEDVDLVMRFRGQPAVQIIVYRVGDESVLAIADQVKSFAGTWRTRLPDGLELDIWQDQTRMLESRLDLLLKNGGQGLALVLLVLAFFLRFRLALWVAVGIPIAIAGTFLVMPIFDISLNMMSLFSFILVLGILVDDAIIVGESVQTEKEAGLRGTDSAVSGVRRVAIPVVFAILTTIVAFTPLMLLPGLLGKFFGEIPKPVILALIFSLVESQLILPSHLAHDAEWMDRLATRAPFSWWATVQQRVAAGLEWTIDRIYTPVLELACRWRYVTVATALTTLLLTVGLVRGGFIRFTFMPIIEGDVVTAVLAMPEGTSFDTTTRAVEQIERAALTLQAELSQAGTPVFRDFSSTIGAQPHTAQRANAEDGGPRQSPHLGEVVIELAPSEQRSVSGAEVEARWRELTGPVAGVEELKFASSLFDPGEPVHVEFFGDDIDALRSAADALVVALQGFPATYDVNDSFRAGKRELVIDLLPRGEALGLSQRAVARQVRDAYYGAEAQRIQRGRNEVKVMVRYPEDARRTLASLEELRVRTATGEVPLATVADVWLRPGDSVIRRKDRARVVDVRARVHAAESTPKEILAEMEARTLPAIIAAHPGVRWEFGGQAEEQAETEQVMRRYFLLALLVIYALIAIPFRSYLQPLIVMTAIPFGLVGAILGHMIRGIDLSMLSVLGFVALAGVVVNDSLVLVDYVNTERARGQSVLDAARAAGRRRFRPILLTSMTTFAGLLPLILERSVQAQFLIPMAVSLAFGVVFSTLVTLLFLPSAYLIGEDLKRATQWILGRTDAEPASDETRSLPVSS